MPNQKNIYIPEPSLRRLPLYHQIVKKYLVSEKQYISCTFIARALNLIPIQVRKDLSFTGITGYPRKGYPLKELYEVLEDFLGWNTRNEAFLVGAGSLGTAMLGYDGFKRIGFEIVAAFDSKMKKTGRNVNGTPVLHINEFARMVKKMKVEIGIITTQWETAQDVADLMVASGIRAIWNFAPVGLIVPDGIALQEENLSASLSVLWKKLDRKKSMELKKKPYDLHEVG